VVGSLRFLETDFFALSATVFGETMASSFEIFGGVGGSMECEVIADLNVRVSQGTTFFALRATVFRGTVGTSCKIFGIAGAGSMDRKGFADCTERFS
jgi:hypothetical protein